MEEFGNNTLATFFNKIRDESTGRDFNLGDLVDVFHQRGYGPLLFFLLIPSLQPIPIPGLGSAFGILVALQGFAMTFSIRPRLPARLARTPIQSKTMIQICNGCGKVFGIVEKLVRPRLKMFTRQPVFQIINGILVFVGGCILSLPLVVPLSNFIPALLVLFICLGILEDDGLMILAGYTYALTLAALFGIFGPRAVEHFLSLL